ncbi:MAG: hypothetical protein MUC96_24990 [Myxococcaceae bacterium]|jgi:hypothetical protein|nr:hypothetical protein [Myxococcaceae bacterium]
MDTQTEIETLKRELRRLRFLVVGGLAAFLVAAAPSTRVLQADRLVLGPTDAPWLVAENGQLELRSGKEPANLQRLVLGSNRGRESSSEPGPSTALLTPTELLIRNGQGETEIRSRRTIITGVTEAQFELTQQGREAIIRLSAIEQSATLSVGSGKPGKSTAQVRAHAQTSSDHSSFARLSVTKDDATALLEPEGVVTK